LTFAQKLVFGLVDLTCSTSLDCAVMTDTATINTSNLSKAHETRDNATALISSSCSQVVLIYL